MPDTLPLAVVADRIGIARATAYRWARAGKFPVLVRPMPDGKYRVPVAAYEAWLAGEDNHAEEGA